MFERLRHWLIPHHTNNYRAKLLHNTGLIILISGFLSFTAFTRLLEGSALHILGFSSSITVDQVVSQINARRLGQGLAPFQYSQMLSQAAAGKAQDMFNNNYWAHISPSGTTPWQFISGAGYSYTYAGENLAKDFSNTDRLMQAWMDSPTHKANIISDKYTETGIAVVAGNLQGTDTVLVVQMFASSGQTVGSVPTESTPQVAVATPTPEVAGDQIAEVPLIAQVEEIPKTQESEKITVIQPAQAAESSLDIFNTFDVKKSASIATTALMIIVLLMDLLIAESKNIQRKVSKNWAHLIFINVMLIAITVINAGHIL